MLQMSPGAAGKTSYAGYADAGFIASGSSGHCRRGLSESSSRFCSEVEYVLIILLSPVGECSMLKKKTYFFLYRMQRPNNCPNYGSA